jgi:hypothetical protein
MDQTHQMKRVCMPCIERKGPLATNLRVQIPSGLQMAKASFTERIGGASAETIRSFFGYPGACPSFTTVHLQISKEVNL